MILDDLNIDRAAFEAGTGWQLKPEGACKGDVCIPLEQPPGERVDVRDVARAMGLPLVEDPENGIWALGPESIGGRALTTAEAPDLRLPDLNGQEFRLSSLRGQKVLVYAWAPY
ncbi:MAG: peroxiredoxin family protein [Pseudomonadales bacterium]